MLKLILTAFFICAAFAATDDSKTTKFTDEKSRTSERLSEQDDIQSIPTSYQFKYSTGNEGPAQLFREEYRDHDGTVKGKYGYVDPHGKLRVVEYRAGAKGYSASGDIGPDIEAQNEAKQSQRNDPSVRAQEETWGRVRANNFGPNYSQPPVGWSSVDPLWNAGALPPQPQQPIQTPRPQPQSGQTFSPQSGQPLAPPRRPAPQPKADKERVWDERAQSRWENTNTNNWQNSGQRRADNKVNWNTWNADQQTWTKQQNDRVGGGGAHDQTSSVQQQWQNAQTGSRRIRPQTQQQPQQQNQWSPQPPPQSATPDQWSPPSDGPTAGRWSQFPQNPTAGQWSQQPSADQLSGAAPQAPPPSPIADQWAQQPPKSQWTQPGSQDQSTGQWSQSGPQTDGISRNQRPAYQKTSTQTDLNELRDKWIGVSAGADQSSQQPQPDKQEPSAPQQWNDQPVDVSSAPVPPTSGQWAPQPQSPPSAQWRQAVKPKEQPAPAYIPDTWTQRPPTGAQWGQSAPQQPSIADQWAQRQPQPTGQWSQPGQSSPSSGQLARPASGAGAVSWKSSVRHEVPRSGQQQQSWPQQPSKVARIGEVSPAQEPPTPSFADQQQTNWQQPAPVQQDNPIPAQFGAPAPPSAPVGADISGQWPQPITSGEFSGSPYVQFQIEHTLDPNQPPLRYQYSY